ncbi:TIGR03546 family protein [Teredinibacter haidensis]|uniref:TIGR03546 family protein n=1 Tax=Teredinibacter haidensis TaxID=2731755 RepID=UPI00094896A5|nr:TIGR03546 family protein [Teredinibacter haidensis]
MNFLFKFVKVISSETNPWQIAIAIMFGMVVGFTPLLRFHNLIILFVVLFFRINIASFLLALGLFTGLAFALDPVMLQVGEGVLSSTATEPLWQALYSSTVGRISQFNHTLTMGSLVVSIVFAPVVLIVSRVLIVQYRVKIMAALNKLHIVRVLKASTIVQRFSGLGG